MRSLFQTPCQFGEGVALITEHRHVSAVNWRDKHGRRDVAFVIAFQAMALSRLGRADEAREKFSSLVRHGQEHRNDSVGFDYFAVSLPDLQMWTDDLSLKNRAHCCYIMALGQYGLGNADEAEKDFTEALSINPDLVDAERLHRIIGKLF